MANPFLPLWEYIPDGEPRVFGDRVYIYGSHDRVACDVFCDFKLKVWSAPINDLNNWVCHGDSFHTRDDHDHKSDTSEWTSSELFAPDVIEKDGKYYLYAYIVGSKGCVGVSDKPEGPFKLLSRYKYTEGNEGDDGIYNDSGVLVDDDGKVYIYYGFTESHMNEINPENMYEIIDGSLRHHVIDDTDNAPQEQRFFEASSPRKINGKYYMIYSPCHGSRLAYAIADKPQGPYKYKGYIVDNGVDFPGGNNHGSIACINGQYYIFYHRMTNNSIMSRRACVEKIEILPDGTIPTVEMTSLGFEDALNPYKDTPADIACVLKGGSFITELDLFNRPIVNIRHDDIIGYKYFDFGEDFSSETMLLCVKVRGLGNKCKLHIYADDYENSEEIGSGEIGTGDGIYKIRVKKLCGRHAIYFKPTIETEGWTAPYFKEKALFELSSFMFIK